MVALLLINHHPFLLYINPYNNPSAYSLKLANWQAQQAKQDASQEFFFKK